MIGFGYKPMNIVRIIKGKKIIISLLVKSNISDRSSLIKAPNIILLYSHKEYVAANTTPVVANIAKYVLTVNIERSTKNSPTKPLVPGKPRLANIKIINENE